MTSGQRQGPALEIVQTRDISAADRRDLGRLWEKLIWRNGISALYTASFYLWYAFAAFLTVSILMAVRALNTIEPELALQLIVAALGFAVFLVCTQWLSTKAVRDKYWTWLGVGDRYALEADGLRWSTRRGVFSCGWSNIETVINDDRHLVAKLPGSGGMFVVKGAFEGQDVEAFGAELVRRWQAQHGPAGAPA